MNIRSITAPNPSPFTLDGTRTWLLGTSAVIDPGPAIDSHVQAIVQSMPQLRTILITHRHDDHAPAAVALKRATGATIAAPHGVLEDSAVDRRIIDGEMIDVGGATLSVVATPGHTAEHVCFLSGDGDLFSGDTILGRGTTAIFPPDGDMSDYIASLRKLRTLRPKRIRPAHGPDRDDAVAVIDEYIEHRWMRERQIIQALERGAGSIEAIRTLVYPDLDPSLARGAAIQIDAHLIKLEKEGRVARNANSIALIG